MGKIKIIFFIFILFFLIAFINCFNFDNDVIYYYSDGNANLYKIKKNFFEYKPVEELYSSTGIYSGGRYFTTKLPDEEFNVIRIYIKKAIKNKIDHINNREKGSGMIIIKMVDKESSYILSPASKGKIQIEMLLMEIKNK